MNYTSTDCRTTEGVTVGIIDSIITLCRLLVERDLTTPAAKEALRDLRSDDDVLAVVQS